DRSVPVNIRRQRSPQVGTNGRALSVALGSRNQLTGSGNEQLDRMQRLTSPGMIDWAHVAGTHHCASCRWFVRKHCWLYVLEMRRRGAKQNVWGPSLPVGQRACRRWEKAPRDGPGVSKRPSDRSDDMVSFGDRYPRQGRTFLNADHLRGKPDMVAVIDRVDLDVEVGKKVLDIVRFENSEYAAAATVTSRGWCGFSITAT